MKLHYICIVLFLGSFIFWGCKPQCDDTPVSRVTFVDKGVVVPDYVITRVIISPDSIEHIIASENGTVEEQWSKPIEASDFDAMQQIIDEHNLFCANDVKGQPGCAGWQGMAITISGTDNSTQTIDIMGTACKKELWPAGVRELIELEDELVEKYQ